MKSEIFKKDHDFCKQVGLELGLGLKNLEPGIPKGEKTPWYAMTDEKTGTWMTISSSPLNYIIVMKPKKPILYGEYEKGLENLAYSCIENLEKGTVNYFSLSVNKKDEGAKQKLVDLVKASLKLMTP